MVIDLFDMCIFFLKGPYIAKDNPDYESNYLVSYIKKHYKGFFTHF